ncbi:MAG: DUF1573 domain-containing protein, partial [Bdellovibrionales bacterium]|nr:DUF1573 domain-containing protein [Bdellovibrionales bacterium]
MMKRVLRFLQIGGVLVLGLPFSVGAAPRLALEQDTFDFGAVAQGEIVKQSFVLKNSGDENLDIQR